MATPIQFRTDTRANWETANPVLRQAEPGVEIMENGSSRIKLGDGTTAWNDLAYAGTDAARKVLSGNSKWGVETITGVKEFTFTTYGHIWTETTSTQTGAPITAYTVDANTAPSIVKAYQASQVGSTVRLVVNADTDAQVTVDTITFDSDHTYTLNSAGITVNSGDRVQVVSWQKGTTLQYNDIVELYDMRAHTPTTNSNQVVIDMTDLPGEVTLLAANPTKCSLVFDDKPAAWVNNGQHLIDDQRKIVAISNVGPLYTITFDGDPISLRTDYNPSFNAVISRASSGESVAYISRTLYPQLAEYVYYSGGVVTVDEQTQNISDFPQQYGGGDISYYGDNWIIPLDGNITTAIGDSITITYLKPGTDITMELFEANHSSTSNEYMWFNWQDELPAYHNGIARGIEGGSIQFFCKVYRPYDSTVDFYMNEKFFHMNHWWDYVRRNGQPNFDFGRDSNDNIFYNFDENGITFREYPFENVSQDIKVRIAYQMKLFIGDTENYD